MNKASAVHTYYNTIYRQKYHSKNPVKALKDPVSALTHMIGAVCAIVGSFPLIRKAFVSGSGTAVIAMSIFMASMILLYSASSAYHSIDYSDRVNLLLRRIDHAMIFVLIAGSYTPVCLLVLSPGRGIPLLITVWAVAAVGIILKIWIIRCPKWISSVIYIAMGWLCVLVFGPLLQALSAEGFGWLLAGGIIYTTGGIIYSLKPRLFAYLPAGFGNHEIFHIFVMAGSLCHYLFMYRCIL